MRKTTWESNMPCGFAWFVIFRDKCIFWSFFEWVRVWFQVKTSVASHLKLLEIIQWRTADGCYVFWMLLIIEVVLSSHSTRTLKPAGIFVWSSCQGDVDPICVSRILCWNFDFQSCRHLRHALRPHCCRPLEPCNKHTLGTVCDPGRLVPHNIEVITWY